MADDNNHRPYRGNDAPARGPAAGSDPLAELARLIGQNDPFAEFGRDGRRAAAPRQAEPASAWPSEPAPAQPAPPQPGATPFGAPDFGRQAYGGAPLAGSGDLYHVEPEAPGYDAQNYQGQNYQGQGFEVPGFAAPGYPAAPAGGGFEQDGFPAEQAHGQRQDGGQFGPEDDDYYDDVPPSRRRVGILAIAGIFALAVIGTAGAFGYRAMFGSSSSSTPPPVIKADSAPSKIVPASAGKDAISNKLINERVNDRGQGEKLVSREEQPVAIGSGTTGVAPAAGQQPGSGVVGADPKKIRTIAIHPDQQGSAASAPMQNQAQPEPPEPAPPPRVTNITPARPAAPAPAPTPRVVNPPRPAAAAEPAARPAPVAERAAPSNAPLSLNPNAVAPAPARAAPAARAVAPPTRLAPQPAASQGSGGYAVQVSAQRSEADAQAAFRSMQAKFPGQLGSRQPLIKRVDLGAKGIYFRAMVGPFGSSVEASQMCSSLKAAGGQCIVQRN